MTPVETIDVDAVRAALLELMAANPSDPLCCTLSDDTSRWLPVDVRLRHEHVMNVIVAGTALDGAQDPYSMLLSHRPADDYRAPFHMVVGRSSVLCYINHVIGDAKVISLLGSQLAQGRVVGLSGVASRTGLPSLIRLTVEQMGTHWREWMRSRRSLSAMRAAGPTGDAGVAPECASPPVPLDHTAAVGVMLDADRYRQFKEWCAAHHLGISVTALMAAATYRAFRYEGMPVADDGLYVLVDLRRYLPASDADCPGNLAVSVLVPTDLSDPAVVSSDLKGMLNSAYAAPTLLKGIVMHSYSSTRRRCGADSRKAVSMRSTGVRMTFNSMQRNPGIDAIPWVDRSRARYMGMSYPVGTDGISVFACVVDDHMEFSASFCPDVLDRAAVQRAMDRLRDMPALLSASVGRR